MHYKNKVLVFTFDFTKVKCMINSAKLIMKIRHLRKNKDDSATQLEELARSQFGVSKLIALLEAQPTAPDAAEGDTEGNTVTAADKKNGGEKQPATP